MRVIRKRARSSHRLEDNVGECERTTAHVNVRNNRATRPTAREQPPVYVNCPVSVCSLPPPIDNILITISMIQYCFVMIWYGTTAV